MNTFWLIYLVGFTVALFFVSDEFTKWCIKNRIDYRKAYNDPRILGMIVLDSLGSWFTVLLYWLSREEN